MKPGLRSILTTVVLATVTAGMRGQEPGSTGIASDTVRFKARVDFVNVNATVTDAGGRFVSGLHRDDFIVYEDDQRVDVAQFSVERTPISLGIVLDTSGSMGGDKMKAARRALERLLNDLADKGTEMFLYRFGDLPILAQDWTTDRRLITRALDRIEPSGNTALYDAVAAAMTVAESGSNQKKVLVVISDGHDTFSEITIRDLNNRIRESDLLVYAIGIDGPEATVNRPLMPRQPRRPPLMPSPFPPGRLHGNFTQWLPGAHAGDTSDTVDATALREMTDDSGGRTEIVRDTRNLGPAMTGIADELGRQYYLGYPSPGKRDGLWHPIRVVVADPEYHVRARRGYVAN